MLEIFFMKHHRILYRALCALLCLGLCAQLTACGKKPVPKPGSSGTGGLPPAGGTAVRLQLCQGGPRRQGHGVISEMRSVQSSFETEISKLLFFVGKMVHSGQAAAHTCRKAVFVAVLAQIPLDSLSVIMV